MSGTSQAASSALEEYHDLPPPADDAMSQRDSTPDAPPPALEAVDLRRLHAEAVACCAAAVARAEAGETDRLADMGRRLAAEQDELYDLVMGRLPVAVREAADKGHRVATVMRFDGADKLREFCYLYMLKGPHRADLRKEMRDMGVRPLLHRLRSELQRAGFGVYHAWQRATNENVLSVTW